MRPLALSLLASFLFFLSGCDLLGSQEEKRPEVDLSSTEQEVVRSGSRFAFKFFRQINDTYRHLIDLLTSLDEKVTLRLAQSIWYGKGFSVKKSFIQTNQEHFDAEVRELDFSRPEAVDIINSWVEDKTGGRIKKVVRQLTPNDVMVLLNALYFHGQWRNQFDKTYQASFHLPGGLEKEVPMMRQREVRLPYYEGKNMQSVELPYGDSLFAMTLVLPDKDVGIDAFAKEFDQETWKRPLSHQ